MEKKEKLEELATSAAAEAVAATAAVNDKLHAEFSKATNVSVDAGTHNHVWLEIAYFGLYLLYKKVSTEMTDEEKKVFKKYLKENFLNYVINIVYQAKGEEAVSLKKYVRENYDARFNLYLNYRGDVSTLFKEQLRNTFNGQEKGEIKFIDNSLTTKLKLKLAFLLGGKEFLEEHKGEVYLSEDILNLTAKNIMQVFQEINLSNF